MTKEKYVVPIEFLIIYRDLVNNYMEHKRIECDKEGVCICGLANKIKKLQKIEKTCSIIKYENTFE